MARSPGRAGGRSAGLCLGPTSIPSGARGRKAQSTCVQVSARSVPGPEKTQLLAFVCPQQCFQADSRMGAERSISKVMAESLESGWFLLERSRTEVEIHVCIKLEVIIAKEALGSQSDSELLPPPCFLKP